MRIAVVVALLAAVSPLQTLAQPLAHGDGRPYGVAKLGLYAPSSDDLDLFNNGPSLSVGFGRRVAPNLALELGIGWFQSRTDSLLFEDPDFGAFTHRETLSVMPITGAVKLLLPLGAIEPFFEAGAGVYFAGLRAEERTGFGRFSDHDDDVALGLHFGGGAAFRMAPRVSLLLEARYHVAEMEFFGIEGRIDGATVNGGVAFHY